MSDSDASVSDYSDEEDDADFERKHAFEADSEAEEVDVSVNMITFLKLEKPAMIFYHMLLFRTK